MSGKLSSTYERGLTFQQYLEIGMEFSIPVVNSSLLKLPTPKHVRRKLDGQDSANTEATGLGTVVHTAVLEPDSMDLDLDERFVFVQTKGLDTKAAAEARRLNPDKVVTNAETIDKARRIRDAVYESQMAEYLLKRSPDRELTGIGALPDEDVVRKIRIDATGGTDPADKGWQPWIVDLKTTSRWLEAWDFHRECVKFGYYLQAAFYLDTDEAITGKRRDKFLIIAVTTDEPYCARVFEIPHSRIEEAQRIYTQRLAALIHALRFNEWFAYEKEAEVCMLPQPAILK